MVVYFLLLVVHTYMNFLLQDTLSTFVQTQQYNIVNLRRFDWEKMTASQFRAAVKFFILKLILVFEANSATFFHKLHFFHILERTALYNADSCGIYYHYYLRSKDQGCRNDNSIVVIQIFTMHVKLYSILWGFFLYDLYFQMSFYSHSTIQIFSKRNQAY